MIEDEGKYYLYRHIRLDTNEVFYVGIGTKVKNFISCKKEYERAFTKTNRNVIWKRIVAKTEYRVEILMESNNYDFIKEKEIEFIVLYGRKNLKTGTLCNLTDGGEGNRGRVYSEETKKKISDTLKEHVFTDERRANISKSLIGKVHSEESIKRGALKRIGLKQSSYLFTQINLNGTVFRDNLSLKQLSAEGFHITSIYKCCRGYQKTHKNFIWNRKIKKGSEM